MGTELAGGPTGRIHLLRADIVGAIGQSVFRFDALCRPGSDLSANPVGAEEGPVAIAAVVRDRRAITVPF